jgi:diaminopimelate epimerase
MFRFYKYHSLGNDFILFDWIDHPLNLVHSIIDTPEWPTFVADICLNHFGIGADGVLVLTKPNAKQATATCLMFNKDGTYSEKCLNGIRCSADYLYQYRKFEHTFNLHMGPGLIKCNIFRESKTAKIVLTINDVQYIKPQTIKYNQQVIHGHIVNAGNPHFIIINQKNNCWLQQYGKIIETHNTFPNKTNIEIVDQDQTTPNKDQFSLCVYERGCGITLACGSGAAATMKVLSKLNLIKNNQIIKLIMPGGTLRSYIDDDLIVQIANAQLVYRGENLQHSFTQTLIHNKVY